jgi:hypothetical protein
MQQAHTTGTRARLLQGGDFIKVVKAETGSDVTVERTLNNAPERVVHFKAADT